MSELNKAAQHRILPTSRLGDTLIVTPGGSLAGYGVGEVNRELARLTRLLAEPGVESLVIDLQGADYYGSEMVGIFVRLQQACRGVTGIVGANLGMRKVFEVMRLDGQFSFYASRRYALKALATVPLRESLRARYRETPGPLRFAATTCALLAVLWLGARDGILYQLVGSPVARDYAALNELWTEFNSLEESGGSYEEEAALRASLQRGVDRLDWRVSMRQSLFGADDADEMCFHEALRCFKSVLHSGDQTSRLSFLHFMYSTRNSIQIRTGLDLPAPARPTASDEA